MQPWMIQISVLAAAAAALAFAPARAEAPRKPAAPHEKPGGEKPGTAKSDAKGDDLKRLAHQGAWRAYSYPEGKGKVCYMTGQPRDRKGNVPKRGESYVLVANRTAADAWGEVSVVQGYAFKGKDDAVAAVGKERFPLFTENGRAWAKDSAKLVKAMAGGKELVVTGTSAHGAKTTDVYPLASFDRILQEIDRACGRRK